MPSWTARRPSTSARAFRCSPRIATHSACAPSPRARISREDLDERVFRAIDALCEAPLINLESAMNHPCQALADWRTLDELEVPQRRKIRAVLELSSARPAARGPLGRSCTWPRCAAWKWWWPVPRGSRCRAPSWTRRSPPRAPPAARSPRPPIAARRSRARTSSTRRSGAARRTTAMREADARVRAGLSDWCVREDWFAAAAPRAKLMHCLPVRRNVCGRGRSARRAAQRRAARGAQSIDGADGGALPHACAVPFEQRSSGVLR